MLLSKYPRVRLGNFPTPIERLDRLSKLFGVNLFAKRDDETGLAGGGNKIRKLEYLIGDAIEKGADTIVTQGAVQSNHVRQTVAACAKMGLNCRVILEKRVSAVSQRYSSTGNVFLDYLLGVESVRVVEGGTDMNKEMQLEAEIVIKNGGKPYIVPGGGSNEIGALGYVGAALEIAEQSNQMGIDFNHVIVTSGSSGTHAGLAVGFKSINAKVNLMGISIRQPEDIQLKKIAEEAKKIAEFLEVQSLNLEEIKVNGDYIGGGYGIANEETLEAIKLAAQYEGMLLDPVYTGKCFAGLVDLICKGQFSKDENILFMHTGGVFGLFAYEDEIMEYLFKDKKKFNVA
jgi:L-cysteate sulfo-lyase